MAYLHWGISPRTPVTGVTPFTYRDNATYLSKLEDLWDRHHEVNMALTDLIAKNATDYAAIQSAYTALVDEWNDTLATLDPAAVHVLVQNFEAEYGGLEAEFDTRLNAMDAAYKAADSSIRADFAAADAAVTSAYTADDNAVKSVLRSEFAAADTSDRNALNATIAANKAAADNSIASLTSSKANTADVPVLALGAVETAVATPTNLRAALDARYSTTSSAFPAQGNVGQRFYISAYCSSNAQKTGNANADAAVQAALNAIDAYVATLAPGTRAAGAPTLVVDGTFLISQPIVPRNGMWIIGNGARASRFITSTSDIISLSANNWWYDFRVEGVGFEVLAGGGACIRAVGVPYAGTAFVNEAIMVRGVITSCAFRSASTTVPLIVLGANAEMHEVTWCNLEIDRVTASTVPAVSIRPHQQNMMNSNAFRDIWLHGHNNVNAYALEVIITPGGGRIHNWSFSNICGEQNAGGLLNLNSINGVTIDHCVEWDSTVPYVNSIINLGAANGLGCTNGTINASFPIGSATYTGIASPIQTHNMCTNIHVTGPWPEGSPRDLLVGHGTSIDACRVGYTVVTANYTMNKREGAAMIAQPGVTVTLPDPNECLPGQTVLLVNDSAGNATIQCTGGRNVNGASTYTLNARSAVRLITGGKIVQGTPSATAWLAVNG